MPAHPTAPALEGFTAGDVEVGQGVRLRVWQAGEGPPLTLLHGYPQTALCWRHVAPALARRHAVVVPDLRGYGASATPPAGPNGEGYTKREMAGDVVALMRELGHERFAVVAHDRGARVGYRAALDHPERVERLAVLDIAPTLETFERMDAAAALSTYHWFFLAQPPPLPERLVAAERELFLRRAFAAWSATPGAIDEEAVAAYLAAFTPEVIAASCADYRAGALLDVEHDAEDRRAGRRISCPLLALWGERGTYRDAPLLDVWRAWAQDVRGRALACGHFLPEEAPEELLRELEPFLAGGGAQKLSQNPRR